MSWFTLFIVVASAIMLVRLWRGPIFVPTERRHVPYIIALLALSPGEKAADLGSGNGRLLIALAEAGAEAHGFEHNPFLVWCARRNIKRAGLPGKAFAHHGNFWNENLSRFDAVVIYGIPYIMGRLERKLAQELRPGARIVSVSFPFPSWQPLAIHKRIYLYRR